MTQQIRLKKSLVVIVVLCAVLILWPASRSEAVVIDGVVTAGDGYTILKHLSYTVEDVAEIQGGAKLWMAVNGGLLNVGLTVPKTLVDNSYGLTRVGWGTKNHKFQELVGSDKAQFIFRNANDQAQFDVTFDYLHALGDEKNDPPYVADKTAKEFKVTTGNEAHVIDASSSMVYNWDTFGAAYPQYFGKDSNSPAAADDYSGSVPNGWVFDVTYEFQVDWSTWNITQEDLIRGDFVEILHASPNKVGKNVVTDFEVIPPDDSTVVPEPVTIMGLLLGVGSLTRYARRRTAA
jgi:hypothetical protein